MTLPKIYWCIYRHPLAYNVSIKMRYILVIMQNNIQVQ